MKKTIIRIAYSLSILLLLATECHTSRSQICYNRLERGTWKLVSSNSVKNNVEILNRTYLDTSVVYTFLTPDSLADLDHLFDLNIHIQSTQPVAYDSMINYNYVAIPQFNCEQFIFGTWYRDTTGGSNTVVLDTTVAEVVYLTKKKFKFYWSDSLGTDVYTHTYILERD